MSAQEMGGMAGDDVRTMSAGTTRDSDVGMADAVSAAGMNGVSPAAVTSAAVTSAAVTSAGAGESVGPERQAGAERENRGQCKD